MHFDRKKDCFTCNGKPVMYWDARQIWDEGTGNWSQSAHITMTVNVLAEAEDKAVFMVVNLTQQTWGRGGTISQALIVACTKKRDEVMRYKITLSTLPYFRLTEFDLDPERNGRVNLEGFSVGDVLPPTINQYGRMTYKGRCVLVDNNGVEIPEPKA